jgi:hypothetical protein
MVTKKLGLEEMERIAQQASTDALRTAQYELSAQDRQNLTLGSYLNDSHGIFEMYVAAEKQGNGRVVSRAKVDRITAAVSVEIDPGSVLTL